MFQKIDNNVLYILKKSTPSFIKIWIMSLILLLIILLFIFKYYQYTPYEKVSGYIKDEHLYIYIKDTKGLYKEIAKIDNKNYPFKIKEISEDYYIVNNSNYYLVRLEIILDKKYMINNNIMEVYIEKETTTFLKNLKKGFDLW